MRLPHLDARRSTLYLIDNIPYDAKKDFKPIITLGMLTGGLVASPKLPVKNIEELRLYALANPGKLNFGTYGPASSANVFRQYLNDRWKTDITEVAYKGANELVAALVNNEIQLTWTALGNWADNPNNSKGIIMTMDGANRSPLIPDVPTYPQAGFGDYPIVTWMGLFAPGETPDPIVAQVNAAVTKALQDPKMIDFLQKQMIDTRVTTAPVFSASIDKERAETEQILRKFNIPKIQQAQRPTDSHTLLNLAWRLQPQQRSNHSLMFRTHCSAQAVQCRAGTHVCFVRGWVPVPAEHHLVLLRPEREAAILLQAVFYQITRRFALNLTVITRPRVSARPGDPSHKEFREEPDGLPGRARQCQHRRSFSASARDALDLGADQPLHQPRQVRRPTCCASAAAFRARHRRSSGRSAPARYVRA